MGSSDARLALRTVVAILTALAAAWIALWYFIPPPPSTITFGAGIKGGTYEHIAERYRQRLARHHIKVDIEFSVGSLVTARIL